MDFQSTDVKNLWRDYATENASVVSLATYIMVSPASSSESATYAIFYLDAAYLGVSNATLSEGWGRTNHSGYPEPHGDP